MPGVHQFPFVCKIPVDLPGSAIIRHGTAKGSVNFNMQAKIAVQGHMKPISGLTYAQIVIKEVPPESMDTGLHYEDSTSIMACCCINRGTPKIEASFEKNVFIIGEKARVLYRLDASNYKDNIDNVTLTVIRSFTMRNGKGRERHFHRTIITKKEVGVAAGVKVEDGQLIELQIGQKDFTLETIQDLPF